MKYDFGDVLLYQNQEFIFLGMGRENHDDYLVVELVENQEVRRLFVKDLLNQEQPVKKPAVVPKKKVARTRKTKPVVSATNRFYVVPKMLLNKPTAHKKAKGSLIDGRLRYHTVKKPQVALYPKPLTTTSLFRIGLTDDKPRVSVQPMVAQVVVEPKQKNNWYEKITKFRMEK